jgi:C-terminal processing protease CtpA/Prc
MNHCTYSFILTALLLFSSCKKNTDESDGRSPVTGSRLELSLDSLYLYAQDTYLWNEGLPDYNHFAPRQYTAATSEMANLETALQAITSYAKDPTTGYLYERRSGYSKPLYSFIAKGNIITGRQGSVGLNGAGDDMGLGLAVVNDTAVYVRYVEQGSPAAVAGITRGLRVLTMNGVVAPTKSIVLYDLLTANSLAMVLTKADGSLMEVVLTRSKYIASPVLKRTILLAGNKPVGYLALARFSDLDKAGPALEEAFAFFAGENLSNMIIDLRYNEGGYVETAEYVANLAAPSAANGKVMYAEHYNNLMQAGKARILAAIPYLDANRQPVLVNGRPATYADADYSVAGNTYRFNKKGGLRNIKSIVFIVSNATASSSELLINCLRPYSDVKLVGSKTFGKPVGFFGIGVDEFTVYLPQFHIRNAAGQGDYFSGMDPEVTIADDVKHDFGDEGEACITASLDYIRTSSYRRMPMPALRVLPVMLDGERPFNGLVEQRLRLK